MTKGVKLTPMQRATLERLAMERDFKPAMGIAYKWGIRRSSPTETVAKFLIQLTKLGLAEKGGTRVSPVWRITDAGRTALQPQGSDHG